MFLERLERRPLQRTLGQRVLDDLVAALRASNLAPQVGDLRNGEAPVVDEDRALGPLERRLQPLEFRFFVRFRDGHQCFTTTSMCVVSIRTPGPIVDDTVTLFKYFPFAAAGFALTMLSTSAWAFSTSELAANDILPSGAWMMPVLSTRNSTLPALISLTAFAMSAVTVPVFGFGIRPRGPRTFPSLPTARIMSGVATTASKSMKPPWILSTRSSPPTTSAPAACASFCFSPPAIASTRLLLPRPCGRTTVPRTIWSACFGSTPSRSDMSTVSSNFAYFTFWTSGIASSIEYVRSAGIVARAATNFLPRFLMKCFSGGASGPQPSHEISDFRG